jgi:hypothetical protein
VKSDVGDLLKITSKVISNHLRFEGLTAVVSKPPAFELVFCPNFSILNMEAICSSETSIDF